MAVAFAHPAERELARVLDAHGIAWEYEPHTFVLERDANGNVSEGFTPDFFLPELGLYLECTTMRQALTSRKRRKARKTRERTGAIVEIVFKRDFDRLAQRWGIPALWAASRGGFGDVWDVPATGIRLSAMAQPAREPDDAARVTIAVEHPDGASVLTVSGDVDLHTAPELRDRLASLGGRSGKVVIDLSGCTFLDSMALGVLLGAQKRLATEGRPLGIVVSTPDVRRIFEITMLDRVLDLHATRAEALAASRDGRAG